MPQRFLRPGIRTSERWNAISRDAQALYIAILTLVDDYGRYDARHAILCADAFTIWNERHPEDVMTPQRIAALSCDLQRNLLVDFYEVDGKKCLQVIQWQERVRENAKEKWPKNPNPLRNPAESCGILPPSSPPAPTPTPSSPPSPAPAASPPPSVNSPPELPRAHFPEVEVPDWEAVKMACSQIGLPEWRAKDWFDEMQAAGWKDRNKRDVMNWRAMLSLVKSWWERDGSHANPPRRAGLNGKPDRPMDIKTIIQAKENLAAQLRTRYCSDTAIDSPWSDGKKKQEFFKLKKEIKALNEQLSNMA